MFADEILALQKSTLLQLFCWSRPNVTHFMPNRFQNTKSFLFT